MMKCPIQEVIDRETGGSGSDGSDPLLGKIDADASVRI